VFADVVLNYEMNINLMNINLININKYSGDWIPVHSVPVHSGEHSGVNSRMNVFCRNL